MVQVQKGGGSGLGTRFNFFGFSRNPIFLVGSLFGHQSLPNSPRQGQNQIGIGSFPRVGTLTWYYGSSKRFNWNPKIWPTLVPFGEPKLGERDQGKELVGLEPGIPGVGNQVGWDRGPINYFPWISGKR